MRWPIQLQLLLPMLGVVVLTITLASAASAYFGGSWARRQQQDNLARVVATLTEARFPLSETVLRQLSGLSGADFVVLDRAGRPRESTLSLAENDVRPLGRLGVGSLPLDLSSHPTVHFQGQSYLAARVPLMRQTAEQGPLSLVVLYREDRWWTVRREAAWPPLMAGGAALLVAIALTTLLAKRFVRPIEQLGRHAEQIARGDFQPLQQPARNDELRDLSLALDRMRARLSQYEQEVRHSERLRVLGQLGAGIAHQLRNWATGARMALDLHRRTCSLGPNDESLGVAQRQFALMESYLRRFLTLGTTSNIEPTEIELGSLIEDVLALVRPACEHARIDLHFKPLEQPRSVRGDAAALRSVLVNLLLNAIEAASSSQTQRGKVVVELSAANERATICVQDSGPGPSEALAGRLFEPFVSDKRDGTGLGLSVAKQVVEDHAGSLRWERPGEMTCFIVELPLAPQGESS